ncbi:hypothetical protein ACFXA3_17320 [Streptomyces sp. NPDC059456]|uniref:hypothetical protein n=1 Tax=Streptomyces sp. NPDC059456 TaxID=3346838 RepID=UPI0036C311AF
MPRTTFDPYRFPGIRGWGDTGQPDSGCPQAPPPDGDRPPEEPTPDRPTREGLTPEDRRRLELQACLTAAGVPPHAGDLRAIEVLSMIDDVTNAAVRRWIRGTR